MSNGILLPCTMPHGNIRIGGNRLSQAGSRFLELAGLPENDGQRVIGHSMVRFDRDRAAAGGNRFVGLTVRAAAKPDCRFATLVRLI
jgi:hypothetical protein